MEELLNSPEFLNSCLVERLKNSRNKEISLPKDILILHVMLISLIGVSANLIQLSNKLLQVVLMRY